MKKATVKIISLILTLVISASVLCGCEIFDAQPDEPESGNYNYHDLFPEGYTGGFRHQPGANIEYWWVETYEECLTAIEFLKSHGSTFVDDTLFTYDGDLFDCKYCFKITGGTTETIKWGDNPFDRYAERVSLTCYAFLEEVTLDELNHSLVSSYESYFINSDAAHSTYADEITVESISVSEWIKKENPYQENHYKLYKEIYYNEQRIVYIGTQFYVEEGTEHELGMTNECINAMIEYGRIIRLNND